MKSKILKIVKNIFWFLSTDIRRGWFACNIVFAAGPIVLSFTTDSLEFYPSVLSYCYALVVVGAYLFYRFIAAQKRITKSTEGEDLDKQTIGKETLNSRNIDTIFWSSLLVAVSILFLLRETDSNSIVTNVLDFNVTIPYFISVIVLAISFYLAYKLNWPMIYQDEERDRIAREPFEKAEKTGKSATKTAGKVISSLMLTNEVIDSLDEEESTDESN